MATTTENVLANSDWPLSNPWPWLLAGSAAIVGGFLSMRLVGPDSGLLRGLLLLFGLLLVSGALCLRGRAGNTAFLAKLAPERRQGAMLALGAVFALLAVGVTLLWLGSGLRMWNLPWQPAELMWLWVVVAPWCGFQALRWLQARAAGVVSAQTEAAALWTLAALGFFLASLGLYDAQQPAEWDSARLVLNVAALVVYVGGILVAASSRVRKILVSLLIVVHFSGILVAVASAPPGPWLAGVLNMQMYRPYLEFMNLSNSYRFYSPEPSPSTQFWFRLEYEDGKGQVRSHWVKLPDINYDGETKYAVSLQFYRRLMLTENAGRAAVALAPLLTQAALQGYDAHPDPTVPRYQPPTGNAKSIFPSFARFITHQPHPKYPELKQASRVKIYRVLHRMITPQEFGTGGDPRDLSLYLPYYQGEYSPEGKLLDANNSTLYILLPFVYESPTVIRANIFKHAGDADFFRLNPKGKPANAAPPDVLPKR